MRKKYGVKHPIQVPEFRLKIMNSINATFKVDKSVDMQSFMYSKMYCMFSLNDCGGYSPFNVDLQKEYTDFDKNGVTPFDIEV